VRFANHHNISFYAVNRGHALTTSVEKFNGIEINMRSLNSIHVNSNNKTALFQGGVYGLEVLETLWDKGFVTGKNHQASHKRKKKRKERNWMSVDRTIFSSYRSM
jgi:FAD/FMN-containing dehydrogenase